MKQNVLDVVAIALCLVGILFLAAVIIGVTGLLLTPVMATSCDNRWVDYQHKYDILGGCMVMQDGKWVPDKNVVVVGNMP
jgi:hypothetical protein